MSRPGKASARHEDDRDDDRAENGALSETTPLLPPIPTVVGVSPNGSAQRKPAAAAAAASTTATAADDDDNNNETAANQTIGTARGLVCAVALGGLILLQATNISLLTTTQSEVADDLHAFEQTSWFTSAYLIAMSAVSPLNGKLASVFGPRACIFASAMVLALGAGVCSVAATFAPFLVGRAVQGVGASGVFTVSIIVALELTGSRRRGIAIALLNSGYTLGVAAGATAAGALLPRVGWRALFWMQAPVAVVAGLVLLLAIPHDFTAGAGKDPDGGGRRRSALRRLARLDYLGALTLTAAIVLLLYALSSPAAIPLLPLALSPVVFTAFVLNEAYLASDPIVPVALLRSRGLLLTCLGTVGYMMARWSVLFYAPTYAIAVRRWSPATGGSILIPTNTGFAVGGLLVGWLHVRRPGSFYAASVAAYALFPVTLALLAVLSTHSSSVVAYVLVVFASGAVTGSALNYTLAHLLHLTPPSTHYVATSLVATFRGFAGSFGSAVGGGLFTRTLSRSLTEGFERRGLRNREHLVRRLLGLPKLVDSLHGVEREVAIEGYEKALRTLFLAGAGLAVVMVLVQAGTGWKGAVDAEARPEDERGSGERERMEEEREGGGEVEARNTDESV